MSTRQKEETGARAELRKKGYLPASEAARKLGYSAQAVYNWLDDQMIHGVRLGRERWVEWASISAYFKKTDPEAAKLSGIA